MKNFLFLFVCSILAACSSKPSFVIKGSVDNPELDGKYVYLCETTDTAIHRLDSVLVKKQVFEFKGEQERPELRQICFSSADVRPLRPNPGENTPFSVFFTLENAQLEVALQEKASTVKGTPDNDAYSELQAKLIEMRAPIGDIIQRYRSKDKEVSAQAEKEYDALDAKIADQIYATMKQNLNSPLFGYLLVNSRYSISEEKQNEIIDGAGGNFKNVAGINKLIEHLEILKKVAVGLPYTDFELSDLKGEMHKLSDIVGKDKVVLIDFWASWCGPCRRSMPALKEVYKKYKKKGFEIVGVSLDSKKEAWEKSIKDLELPWLQLSDVKGWQCEPARMYGVNSIPHTVLIGKDGVIAAKNLHGEDLEVKIKELLK